jgi:hypothetical protein
MATSRTGFGRRDGLGVHPPARHQAAANTAFLMACGNAIERKNIFGHARIDTGPLQTNLY